MSALWEGIWKNYQIGDELAVCLLGVNREDRGGGGKQAITRSMQAHLKWTESAPWAHFSNFAKKLSENPWSSSLQTP